MRGKKSYETVISGLYVVTYVNGKWWMGERAKAVKEVEGKQPVIVAEHLVKTKCKTQGEATAAAIEKYGRVHGKKIFRRTKAQIEADKQRALDLKINPPVVAEDGLPVIDIDAIHKAMQPGAVPPGYKPQPQENDEREEEWQLLVHEVAVSLSTLDRHQALARRFLAANMKRKGVYDA